MKKQITNISPIAAAKVMALLYVFMSIPFMLIMVAIALFGGHASALGVVMAIFTPVLYAIVGFIVTIIGALLYNVAAKLVGGVEYTVRESA